MKKLSIEGSVSFSRRWPFPNRSLCDHLSSRIWHNLVVGPFKREALGALLNLLLPKSELNQRRSSLSFSSEVEVNQMAASSAESRGAAPAPPLSLRIDSPDHMLQKILLTAVPKNAPSLFLLVGPAACLGRFPPRVTESGLQSDFAEAEDSFSRAVGVPSGKVPCADPGLCLTHAPLT